MLLATCVSNSASTQSTVPTKSTIKIVVTESDGIPIQGAAVSINGKPSGETDANGILTVSGMTDGQITVSKDGYFTNTINAVKGQNGLKAEQTVWLTRSGSSGSGSTYSRGSLTRGQLRDMNTGLGAAIIRVSRNLVRALPKNQKIAVLNCTASDEDTSVFVTDSIEQQLFDAGYSLVDRSQLDKIRAEQNFQLSGDVDDNQIVSIGKMAAARIVVTGRVAKMGNIQSLTLRALNVETGELISRASDQF
ncbi:MAG: hypothetical protein LBU82_05520 [Treponema sp.]|nr:hypothetical protein [Treponema sp.]